MPRDAAIGGVILAFAGLYWLAAGTIRRSSLEDAVGAAGVPNVLAAMLAGLAVLLIVRGIVTWLQPAPRDRAGETGERPNAHLRALGMLALGIGFLVIVPHLGYVITVGLLLAGVALYNHRRPTPELWLFAVLGAAGFYVLFVKVLGIPLPPGLWPDVLPL
jgi:uncharacterized protein YjeT (DUF2065 family)